MLKIGIKMIVEVMEKGVFISKSGERLIIKKKGEKLKEIPISKVEGLIIGKGIALSSDSLVLCSKNNVPVFFYSSSSTYFLPSSSLSKPSVRISQMKLNGRKKKIFIYKLVKWKLENQKRVAQAFGEKLEYEIKPDYSLPLKDFISRMLNKEALSSKKYWNTFASKFRGFRRVKLFAEDNLNKSLNYGYGILKYSVEKAILSCGLDPFIGIYHSTKDYRESFIFDVMEPLRPFVDFCVFSFLDEEKMEKDFSEIKHELAKTIVGFFKKDNFSIGKIKGNLQRCLIGQGYLISDFFKGEEKLEFVRVKEWSLKE